MLLMTTLACLCTGFGGLLVVFKKKYSKQNLNVALNMSAGVMLGAAFYSLLFPAFNIIRSSSEKIYISGIYFIIAIALGGGVLWLLNMLVPHEHSVAKNKDCSIISSKTVYLFVMAMAIHKLPEGFAMGVAYGAESIISPDGLMIGMAFQNIPEGLMIAISLISINCKKIKSLLIASLVGFVQPVGAILGYLMMNISPSLLAYGMAFAGSTMLFVIINEMLPEIYGGEKDSKSSIALFLGFIVMSYLTIILD